jgi:excisionase family DNA binding protein
MRKENQYLDEVAPTDVFARPGERLSPRARIPEDRLWDVNDVARYLGVSKSWVYHRAEAGLLPYRRVGGLLRFEPNRIRSLR